MSDGGVVEHRDGRPGPLLLGQPARPQVPGRRGRRLRDRRRQPGRRGQRGEPGAIQVEDLGHVGPDVVGPRVAGDAQHGVHVQVPQAVQLLLEHDPVPVPAGQRHPGPGPGRLQQRRQAGWAGSPAGSGAHRPGPRRSRRPARPPPPSASAPSTGRRCSRPGSAAPGATARPGPGPPSRLAPRTRMVPRRPRSRRPAAPRRTAPSPCASDSPRAGTSAFRQDNERGSADRSGRRARVATLVLIGRFADAPGDPADSRTH